MQIEFQNCELTGDSITIECTLEQWVIIRMRLLALHLEKIGEAFKWVASAVAEWTVQVTATEYPAVR